MYHVCCHLLRCNAKLFYLSQWGEAVWDTTYVPVLSRYVCYLTENTSECRLVYHIVFSIR